LAIQFAQLLGDMWATSNTSSDHSPHVVYPRSFKYTLGRHAEQFVGYDQHDSQELATYLLDALHEDTNRVTHKPYVEKPEQADGESDHKAAEKAWALHLEREDSQVLEYFMGQVKSRVQCCKPTCGRVSTTFDPFMFLSVPIPGASERSLRVCFAPLDPMCRTQEVTVQVPNTASIGELVEKVLEQLQKCGIVAKKYPHDS
jgi:ubiquitin carboxyl-terminal hydrolase 4/11/15